MPAVQLTITNAAAVGSSFQYGFEILDTATLTGAPVGLAAPTGTITFSLFGPVGYPYAYGPESCGGNPAATYTEPIAESAASTPPFLPPRSEEKVYLYTARYSGDQRYASATSECDAPGSTVHVPLVADGSPETRGNPEIEVPPARGGSQPLARVVGLHLTPNAFATTGNHAGTTIGYTLSAPAAVTITFSRAMHGLLVRSRCIADTDAARERFVRLYGSGAWKELRSATCTFYAHVGGITKAGTTGADSFRFAGRVGGRLLPAGVYRATAAVTASLWRIDAAPSSAVFKVMASPR